MYILHSAPERRRGGNIVRHAVKAAFSFVQYVQQNKNACPAPKRGRAFATKAGATFSFIKGYLYSRLHRRKIPVNLCLAAGKAGMLHSPGSEGGLQSM